MFDKTECSEAKPTNEHSILQNIVNEVEDFFPSFKNCDKAPVKEDKAVDVMLNGFQLSDSAQDESYGSLSPYQSWAVMDGNTPKPTTPDSHTPDNVPGPMPGPRPFQGNFLPSDGVTATASDMNAWQAQQDSINKAKHDFIKMEKAY